MPRGGDDCHRPPDANGAGGSDDPAETARPRPQGWGVERVARILHQHAATHVATLQQESNNRRAQLKEEREVFRKRGEIAASNLGWWRGYKRWSAARWQLRTYAEWAPLFDKLRLLAKSSAERPAGSDAVPSALPPSDEEQQ